MLRKSDILRGYRSFSRIITRGKPAGTSPVRAFFVAEPAEIFSLRVGFSVSRSVKKATVRNRAKRLLRETYRAHKHIISDAGKKATVEIILMYSGYSPGTQKELSYDSLDLGVVKALVEIAGRLKQASP